MSRPRPRAPVAPPPARADWLIAVVAAIGVVVGTYLAVAKWTGGSAVLCTAGGGCDIVQASRYAVFLGLPTAAWGAGLYAAVGGLALAGLTARRWLLAFLLATAAVAFSAYLTYLELFVIRALCGYCVVSAAVAAALFGVILARRPVPPSRRSALQPRRLVLAGAVMAVATLAAGIGGYALETLGPAPGDQEALARHLGQSGAVFYGAFW